MTRLPRLSPLLLALLLAVPALADGARTTSGAPLDGAGLVPATAAEVLAQKIGAAWNVAGLDEAARQTRIVVLVQVGPDGRPGQITLVESDGPTPAATEAAFASARRAVVRAMADGVDLPEQARKAGLELVFDARSGVAG